MPELTAVIYLVFMDNGVLFGSYWSEIRANGAAKAIDGVVCSLPIVMDYRKG